MILRKINITLTVKHIQCAQYCVSTAPQTEQISLPRFRTLENNPVNHTPNHVGKFYMIDKNLKDKLFFAGGISQSLETQMKVFQECCIMVREPALEILSYLKKMNYTHPALRFVIYGENGTGKTSTLIHLIHYASVMKHLIIHIPWVSIWTKRPKETVDSQSRPGRIDLPVESTMWLQHFKLQNSKLLEELDLRTTKDYTWSKREFTEKGSPITDIIEQGTNRVAHSSDCIAVLLKEIKHHSQFGKFKTFVAIDGVNAFYCKTNVKRPDKTLVPASEITIVHAFQKMIRNDWTHAAVVTTVDTLPVYRGIKDVYKVPYTPRALLGKDGFEHLDPFIPVQVDYYLHKEVESVLDYYIERKWITDDKAKSERGRRQLKFLSGRQPFELMRLCDPL